MSETLIRYQFKRYFFAAIIFDLIIFALYEGLPFIVDSVSGKMSQFYFTENIGYLTIYLSIFTFFYICSTYSGYFKLGMQNGLSRHRIWQSQLVANLLIAIVQVFFTFVINFAVILPFRGANEVNSTYYVAYNDYLTNPFLKWCMNIIVSYLLMLLVIITAMTLATLMSLVARRFRKWLVIGFILIFFLLLTLTVFASNNITSFSNILTTILFVLGFLCGFTSHFGSDGRIIFSHVGNPLVLSMTLLVLIIFLIWLGRALNDRIQIHKLV